MSPLTTDQVKRKLWAASWGSKGSAPTDHDKLYWNTDFWNALDKHGMEEMNPPVPDYAYKRAIGWQASGADVPPYGPYANPPSPLHVVPPLPGDVLVAPEPTPDPTPEPIPDPTPDPPPDLPLAAIVDRLERLETLTRATAIAAQQIVTAVIAIRDKQNPPYRGEYQYPASIRGGTRTVHLVADLKPGADGVKR